MTKTVLKIVFVKTDGTTKTLTVNSPYLQLDMTDVQTFTTAAINQNIWLINNENISGVKEAYYEQTTRTDLE